MSMVEKFKNSKKTMMIKTEQAAKMANDAVDEFIDSVKSLAKDASEKDLEEILNTDDKMVEYDDKIAIVKAYVESRSETHKNLRGVVVISVDK